MRRLLSLLALLSLPLAAQEVQPHFNKGGSGSWVAYTESGCIGGATCSDRRLRVPLEDRPVISVRFHAHDQIGAKAEGVLRVKIDGNAVEGHLDVPRAGKKFTVDVDELRGRYLVFEPANNDEVEISQIEVLYASSSGGGRRRNDDDDRRPGRGGGASGWRSYPQAAACIGGETCRKNGNRITIALEDAPVLGVRFWAHDSIGNRADGKLAMRIDTTSIGWSIDIQRAGKRHEIDVDNLRGSRLVLEANDDEVEVRDIEVLYGRNRRSDRFNARAITHEGGCIGGSECGGRRARIRIAIYGRSIESVRFYARDDIGTRAGGQLRIRVDDEILRDYLDIPREGRTFTIQGNNTAGDYLYIEPAEDDEVDVKDVRVTFGEDED